MIKNFFTLAFLLLFLNTVNSQCENTDVSGSHVINSQSGNDCDVTVTLTWTFWDNASFIFATIPGTTCTDFTDVSNGTLVINCIVSCSENLCVDITAEGLGGECYMSTMCFGVLPVELSFFGVSVKDNKPVLDWITESEINNKGFEILHSTNGTDWTTVSFVEGKGNSDIRNSYSYIHEVDNLFGVNYYKLKQVDFDETFDYSVTRAIEISYKEVKVYPNPVSHDRIRYVIDNKVYKTDITGYPNGAHTVVLNIDKKRYILRFVKH